MRSHISLNKYQQQKGFTLLEVAMFMILISVVFLASIQFTYRYLEKRTDMKIADQVKTFAVAVKNYILENQSGALTGQQGIKEVAVSELVEGGFLFHHDLAVLPNGQELHGYVIKEHIIDRYDQWHVFVISRGPVAFTEQQAANIALNVGASGGVTSTDGLRGVYRNWALKRNNRIIPTTIMTTSTTGGGFLPGFIAVFDSNITRKYPSFFVNSSPSLEIERYTFASDGALSYPIAQGSGHALTLTIKDDNDYFAILLKKKYAHSVKVTIYMKDNQKGDVVLDSYYTDSDEIYIRPKKDWGSRFAWDGKLIFLSFEARDVYSRRLEGKIVVSEMIELKKE